MLLSASIRDIVLIDSLDLAFGGGLCVLTGETGAGKSILLDAIAFVTGARSDRTLLRAGAETGSVTAVFDPEAGHPARVLLAEAGVAASDEIILRRGIGADGRSRAFINDTPVSISLLRNAGEMLVEIHGQNGERGLLAPAGHRDLLDAFVGAHDLVRGVEGAYRAWVAAREALAQAEDEAARAAADADYVRHAAKELGDLAPEPGEEDRLTAERTLMQSASKIAGELNDVSDALGGANGFEARLSLGLRRLERLQGQAGSALDAAVGALTRALIEAGEARAQVDEVLARLRFDAHALQCVDDRLHALRDAARKYRVTVDALPQTAAAFAARVQSIEGGAGHLAALQAAREAARTDYFARAQALSQARTQAARALEARVARELKPLKFEKARFRVSIDTLADEAAGPSGRDAVAFEVSTNPGAPFGPLHRIASGGEVARFVLALKVALAGERPAGTLIFDEADQGVGGAVADAVGERLKRLSKSAQVIVVTHSPQIAALADRHFRISKSSKGQRTLTRVETLDEAARREEIARMLSGATVTQEARAAADRLMAGAAR